MITMKNTLIITNSQDLHADLVSTILVNKGHQPFRVNLDKFPRDYTITQKYIDGSHASKIVHTPTGTTLESCQIAATWNRKIAEYSFISDDLTVQELEYAKAETEHAMFGLLYTLDCYWMSHPVNLRGSMWKGEQLNRAQKIGFRIPASLVSNCPDEVRDFKNHLPGDMIFKTLSTPDLASSKVSDEERVANGVPTTVITNEFMENVEAVREVPCHFQEYIPKLYELRVTIIGDKLFAAKIHSQEDQRTMVDSRDMTAEILYEAIKLPEAIEKRCFAFVKSYGLNYSAMDIIVTPDNEYVFLENNPNGQFLYVQQLIPEYNMLETLADTLIKEVECRSQ